MISYTLNIFRVLLLATALTGIVQPAIGLGDAEAADSNPKVVYHADFADPRRFSAMLTDDELEGTPFSADAALEERRSNLKGRLTTLNKVHGVKLELCNITRTEIDLPEGALYEGTELVPSGVVRLAELQAEDFAYIKIE
jgi:hypothetical protein